MCRRVECSSCGMPTFAGCGAHVEQVLAGVAPDERCRCREEKAKQSRSQDPNEPRSWLRDLFGK